MAIQMTREQYEETYGAPAPVTSGVLQSSAPSQSGKIQMTRKQYQDKYGVSPGGEVKQSIEQQKKERQAQGLPVSMRDDRAEPTKAGNLLRSIVRPLGKFGQNAKIITKGLEGIESEIVGDEERSKQLMAEVEQLKSGENTKYLGNIKPVGETGKGIGADIKDVIGSSLEVASLMPISAGAGTVAKAGITGLKGAAIPTLRQLGTRGLVEGGSAGFIGGTGRGLQEDKSIVDSITQGATEGAIGGAFGGVLPIVGKALGKTLNKASAPAKLLSSSGRKDIVTKTIDKGVDELLTKNRGMQNKVKELVERKRVNVKEILSEPAIFRGLKVQGNRIDPSEAIEVIKERISLGMDAKNKLLPELDKKVQKIPKRKIREKALAGIRGQYSPADEEDILRDIDRQLKALPDDFSLSEADNFRARFRKSSRDAKGLQKRDSEYAALENAFRDAVFDVTDDLPFDTSGEYAQLNKFIKDMIDTELFLDKTVRGQIVKGGKLGNYIARGIGAIAGAQGGILTTLLGAELGGFVANIVTNNQLGSTLKMKLIKNVVDDPAILKQIENMVQKTQKFNPIEMPALPPGPIIAGPAMSPDMGFRLVPAKKYPTSINPKTGKFQRVYKSD